MELDIMIDNHVNEEPYCEPASREEDIKKQLTNLKVETILKDNIDNE